MTKKETHKIHKHRDEIEYVKITFKQEGHLVEGNLCFSHTCVAIQILQQIALHKLSGK
jgi:hypothetical protein